MLATVSSYLSAGALSYAVDWGWFEEEEVKLLNIDLDDEVDFVDCYSISEPNETPFPEKAEKFGGVLVAGADPAEELSGAAWVAVALELPPPKKLERPPPLEDEACVDDYELFCDGLLARVEPVSLKLGSSLYFENGHLFSHALIDSVEVSKHFK